MKNYRIQFSLILIIIIISSTINIRNNMGGDIDDQFQMKEKIDDENSLLLKPQTSYISNNEKTSTSSLSANFQTSSTITQNNETLALQNCQDWDISSNFIFNNIRAEAITNGNAETEDELWTEYLPPSYEGNVTRTDSPDIGEVISDDYSWYFNIETQDTTTIVGFDNPISVSSHSVIFSFSYSLLYNSLSLTKYSNICIRLFFQFDIYIFIWFNGNPGTLSNVTGPGGYADLLINEADFDSQIHDYSLNITELGLQLFNQEPDELRSFAVQTWGAESYQMDFMLDDISLTDEISPSSINLKVANETVLGTIGSGSITLEHSIIPEIDFTISYLYNNLVYWDCIYTISGVLDCLSQVELSFYDFNYVNLIENYSRLFELPTGISSFWYEKRIPNIWIINDISIDTIDVDYSLIEWNSTYNLLSFDSLITQNNVSMKFFDDNKINAIQIQDHFINHDEVLLFSVESQIIDKLINYQILLNNEILFENITRTDENGNVVVSYSQIQSNFERANYSLLVYWTEENAYGIGQSWFEITSFPTKIECFNSININYGQKINLNIRYFDLENELGIEQASIHYEWNFGSGNFQPIALGNYSVVISSTLINPGNYSIKITGSKLSYATTEFYILIQIEFSDINLILETPDYALPGETIKIVSKIFDINLDPLINLDLKYYINDIYFLETQTNSSGISEIYYHLSATYSYPSLNVTCTIVFEENETLSSHASISIELLEIYRSVTLSNINQLSASQLNNLVSFSYRINYPTSGEKWICDIPQGFDPIRALIVSLEENITANLSLSGKIYWNKSIISSSDTDILLLDIAYPNITCNSNVVRNELIINIEIETKNIPFSELLVTIPKEVTWSDYTEWRLLENDIDISTQISLLESDDEISFKISSSIEDNILIYQIKGLKNNLLDFSPSTIVLGIGITTFTVSTSVLVFKKKKNISLDIQI